MDSLLTQAPNPPAAESSIDALERQMSRAALHSHTIDSQLAERIHALESTLYALVDLVVKNRLLGESELAAAAHRVAQSIEERRERANGGVALRVDPPDSVETHVNCAERMPICKAICCRLSFALTAEEIQSGRLKWDLGKPYFMRHGAHGACVHQDCATGACTVYADRPNLCRHYSCEHDTRIWKDFAKKVLNQEWIDAHLGLERPQLMQARMDPISYGYLSPPPQRSP